MEKYDEDLISQWIDKDPELKRYVEEHKELEQRLGELEKKPFLTGEEEILKKNLKKLKLRGKDQIELILSKYRNKTLA